MTISREFYDLFRGRPNRIGQSEPLLVDGKNVSIERDATDLVLVSHPDEEVERFLEIDYIEWHLTDPTGWALGTYPAGNTKEGLTRWGCFDFDSKTSDPARDASMCLTGLRRAGLNGVIESSRSGAGRHVWVFIDGEVPAETMRKALMLIDKAIGLECNEINPKQRLGTDFTKNHGNYVRLPYHYPFANADKPTMVAINDEGEHLSLEEFVALANRSKVTVERIEVLAQRWHVEPPPPRPVKLSPSGFKISDSPTQDAQFILAGDDVEHGGGVVDGRNNKLWNLACYLAEHPRYDESAAEHAMAKVHREQLVQSPDVITLDVCLDMVRRAFLNQGE